MILKAISETPLVMDKRREQEILNNKYAAEGWGTDPKVPSHLRPVAAGEYLTANMVPLLWIEIRQIQRNREKAELERRYKEWLAIR